MDNLSQDPSNISAQNLINNDKNAKTTQNLLANLITQGGDRTLSEASIKLQAEMVKELRNKKMEILGAEVVTIKGEKGETGEKGDKGDKGDTGKQGIQGIQGEKGEVGERGLRGFRGATGEKGESGKDGKNGINGKDGKDAKLNLKSILSLISGKLKMSDISDAPEFKTPSWLGSGYTSDLSDWGTFMSNLQAGVYGGGVETITTVAGTTTYTLTHTPKYLTYNGQAIYEGAGYSLAGLTITLDEAPIASDVLRSHY